MSNKTNLPNYLHIGYSKAASTWLQELLRKDKDVFLVYKSDFFFPLDTGKYKKGIEYYSTFFEGSENFKIRIESHEHIILPFHHPELKCASTNAEVVETAARRIKECLPEIKIILIIRNQTDMLLSRYTQYILQGGKVDASEFLKQLVIDDDNYLKFMDYRYSKIIRKLYDVFGASNVQVLFQEELIHKPEAFIDSLSTFFIHSLSYAPGDMTRKKNPAPSFYGIKVIQAVNRIFVRKIETIESKTKTWIPWIVWALMVKLVRYIDGALVKNKNKKRLFTPEQKRKIKAIYAGDNKKLSGMFDKPVLEYGYYYRD
jgi:hypothetical protein